MWKLVFVLILVLLLSACGSNEINEPLNVIADVDVDKNQIEITTEAGDELVISKDIDESVELPKEYPKDIFPIYRDSYIAAASKSEDGSFLIIGYTNDDMKDVKEFYMEILKDAKIIIENSTSESYMNMGEMEGMSYTLSIAASLDDLDYKLNFNLMIMQIDDSGSNEELQLVKNSTEKTMNSTSDRELPINYPEDIIPVYNSGSAEVSVVLKQSGQVVVGLMTIDEIEVVTEYYRSFLSIAEDYSLLDMNGTILLMGTLDERNVTVTLTVNSADSGEDTKFNTLIKVIY